MILITYLKVFKRNNFDNYLNSYKYHLDNLYNKEKKVCRKHVALCLAKVLEMCKLLNIKNWVATQSATPRHMSRLLRLLPSGPGRVHRVSLRGDRKGHHRGFKNKFLKAGELSLIAVTDASRS